MILSMVVAQGRNGEIGKENKLLWYLPADLQFFKKTTTGRSILMGRKTFESIGRALPNRRNIIISRDPNFKIEGGEVYPTIDLAIKACEMEDEVFIIGGASIYNQAFPKVDKIYLTQVDGSFDADTFFPTLDPTKWEVVWEESHTKDEKNLFDFTFRILKRSNSLK